MDGFVTFEIGHKTVALLCKLEKLKMDFDTLSAQLDTMVSTVATIKSEIDALKVVQTQGDLTPDQEAQIAEKISTLQAALNDAAADGAPPTS